MSTVTATRLEATPTASGIIHHARLANGLLVLLKPDAKAPVISLNVAYRVGSKFEGPGVTGISHLLEHMMFKTTHTYALGEFDRQLKVVGADNNAYTWLDQTVYYETIAADQIDVALRLEADRMRGLALTAEDHAFEMTVVRNELDQRDDNPFTLLYEELLATAFVAHAYRVPTIGYKDDVEAITPADLRTHYDRFYHPDNAFIVAVGDFEPADLLARIEAHFSSIPAGGVTLPRLTQEPPQQGERRFEIVRAGQVDYLLIAWHIPAATHPDSYPLVVLGTILGDGRTSRLYKALVDTGLTAEAAAWASNFGHSDPFLFFCSAMLSEGVECDQIEPVFYGVIADLATNGPTDAELARAKKAARVSFIFDHDSIERQAGALVEFELMSSWRDLDSYLPGIEAVTAEDVKRVAQEYLTQRNRTVGKYIAIKPQQAESAEPAAAIDPETFAGTVGEPQIGVIPPQRSGGRPAAGSAAVQAADAAPAERKPVVFGQTTVVTLDNGLRILARPSHGNPTVSLQGLVRAGRIDDPPGLPGVGSFAIDMLASGTEQYDKFALAAWLEDNGMELHFSPGREGFNFGGRALSEDFSTLLDALAEMLLRSTFPAVEVEKTRRELQADLLDSMNSTRAESAVAARELLYGSGHPFSGRISGTPDSLRRIQRDDLAEWYRQHFTLDGAIVTVVGDIEPAAVVEQLTARFGGVAAGGVDRSGLLVRSMEMQDVGGQRRHVEIKEKSNVSLAWVTGGPAKTDPLWAAYFVTNFIFGGDFYSRLNERLRVKDGLTYGSGSRFVNGLAHGPLMITAQVSPRKVEQAIAATLEELERFSTQGASAEELQLAQSYLIGNFPVQLSTNSALASLLTDCVYLGRGVDYMDRYAEIIRGVTLEQVNAIAAKQYAPGRMGLVTAGSLG
jgi:zinc protease